MKFMAKKKYLAKREEGRTDLWKMRWLWLVKA